MELFYNRSWFWFLFSVGSGAVTHEVMFLVHVCDCPLPSDTSVYCYTHHTPWSLDLPSDRAGSMCVILSIILQTIPSFLSLYFCHTPSGWTGPRAVTTHDFSLAACLLPAQPTMWGHPTISGSCAGSAFPPASLTVVWPCPLHHCQGVLYPAAQAQPHRDPSAQL